MRKNSGFTLVELLVVMALVAVLAGSAIAFINPLGQFQKQRDAQRKSDLAQVQRALETYYNDFGKYPDSNTLSESGSYIVDDGDHDWGTPWTPYIASLPQDPQSNQKYRYFVSSDNQQYWLYAHLERPTDPQVCIADGTTACTGANSVVTSLATYPCGDSSTYVCNFGVSSPNASP